MDINAALVLVRVAQAESFRGAAKVLDMPKTSVSRKVAELEARLGVQLLRRTTRRIALTDAGVAYVDAAQSAIATLEAAEDAVSQHQRELQGRIRVTAPAPFGQGKLTELITEFLLAHPRVEVQLHMTYRPVDLLTERFDVALRYGNLPDSSLMAIALSTTQHVVVASPTYLAKAGTPQSPAELSAHDCLVFASENPSLRSTWTLLSGKRKTEVQVQGRFAADDLQALRTAALDGLGIARLPAQVVAADVASGALVAVLQGYTSVPTPLHLVHAGERFLPARTRTFIDFLVERLSTRQPA